MWCIRLNRLAQRGDDGDRRDINGHQSALLRPDDLDFLVAGFALWHGLHLLCGLIRLWVKRYRFLPFAGSVNLVPPMKAGFT